MNDLVEKKEKKVHPRNLKESRRKFMLEYLSNPDNPWVSRKEMSELLGIHKCRLHVIFTPAELAQIDAEARLIRRKGYMKELVEVDKKMINKAKTGDVKAAKLVYEQLDEPVAKTVEVTGPGGGPLQAEVLLAALLKKEQGGTDG
jgi:hypothetical protein